MFRCCICIEDLKNDINECELQPDLNHSGCIPKLTNANYMTKKKLTLKVLSQCPLSGFLLSVGPLSQGSLKVLSMSLTLTRFSLTRLFSFLPLSKQ